MAAWDHAAAEARLDLVRAAEEAILQGAVMAVVDHTWDHHGDPLELGAATWDHLREVAAEA